MSITRAHFHQFRWHRAWFAGIAPVFVGRQMDNGGGYVILPRRRWLTRWLTAVTRGNARLNNSFPRLLRAYRRSHRIYRSTRRVSADVVYQSAINPNKGE